MASYHKQVIRHGVGTLDLRHASDLVDVLNGVVLTNVMRHPDGGWTSRVGQTYLATSGTSPLHSIVRGNDPQSSTTRFLWGASTAIYGGNSGALTSLSTGYSGNPVSFVPWRVKQSGESWVIVGDTNKMVKIRVSDGLVLPLGLPIPASACTTSLASANTKTVDAMTAGFANPGYVYSGGATVPIITFPGAAYTNFLTVPGAATGAFVSFTDKASSLDLTTYGGVAISDDDYVHIKLTIDNPTMVSEIKLYFTTYGTAGATTTFTAGRLPGSTAGYNEAGFAKAFRPSDAQPTLQGATAVATAPTILSRRIGDDGVRTPIGLDEETTGTFPDPAITTVDTLNTAQAPSSQQSLGAGASTEWGTVGFVLRRGDFLPFGTDANANWATVIGLTLVVSQPAGATAVNVQFDDWYITGGAGPDTGEPGTQKYDYVATNYDPRTGAESNTSAVQSESNWLDALRRGITVDPPAYGDAAVRQRFYRRGGTLTDDWRYVGVNSTDGGTFTDTLSDTEIVSEDTVPTDYFQAVPSVLSTGVASLAKPVPYVWGPLQDIILASGDPNRPGSVYYCYPNNVDAWSANGYADVSPSAEPIIAGFILGAQAFAWSTARLYALNINFGDSTTVSSTITGCTRAPISPWAFCVGEGAAWFCASDGVFATSGNKEVNITDEWLRPLFMGLSSHGIAPVDFTATSNIRLWIYQNELYFTYRDTNGAQQCLIYHLLDHLWRHAQWGKVVIVGYPDLTTGVSRLLLGSSNGNAYVAAGTDDAGVPISASIATGQLNQGYPKSLKRYSDYTVDCARGVNDITVGAYSTYDQTLIGTTTINSGSLRQPYITSFSAPVLSPTLSFQYSWTSSTTPPILYLTTLSFELEPPTITQWNSLPTDHGIDAWHVVSGMFLTFRSSAVTDISVTSFTQSGTSATQTYTVPSTGGEKLKRFIPFYASKGAEYSYQISSASPLTLYPEASYVVVTPWGSPESRDVRLIDISNEGTIGGSALTALAATTAGG